MNSVAVPLDHLLGLEQYSDGWAEGKVDGMGCSADDDGFLVRWRWSPLV